MVLENTCVDFSLHFFLGIYNKFVKFIKNLTYISIILKKINSWKLMVNILVYRLIFKYQEVTRKFSELFLTTIYKL